MERLVVRMRNKKFNKKGDVGLLSGMTAKLILAVLILLVVGLSYLVLSGKLQGMAIYIKNLFRFR